MENSSMITLCTTLCTTRHVVELCTKLCTKVWHQNYSFSINEETMDKIH